jgi:hypothetical protein
MIVPGSGIEIAVDGTVVDGTAVDGIPVANGGGIGEVVTVVLKVAGCPMMTPVDTATVVVPVPLLITLLDGSCSAIGSALNDGP